MINSKDFTVTSVSGKQLPRNRCRYIKKEYYEINVDCFLMPDNCWHRVNNGKIAFDNEIKQYVMIEGSSLREGIIGIKENGEFLFGMFSSNPAKNTEIDNIPCISYEIAESLGAKERIATGTFYTEEKAKTIAGFNNRAILKKYSFPLDYSAGPRIRMFSEAYNQLYKPKDYYGLKPVFGKELGNTTFG